MSSTIFKLSKSLLNTNLKIHRICLNYIKTSSFDSNSSESLIENDKSKRTDLIFSNESTKPSNKAENISRAMRYYLEKSSERGKIINSNPVMARKVVQPLFMHVLRLYMK